MIRYPDNLISEIRLIRETKQLSYYALAQKYSIPSSTVRNWCCDLPVPKGASKRRRNILIREGIKQSEVELLKTINLLGKSKAKLWAALLYGCEGAKYPSSNKVLFSNSNPQLISAFYSLLLRAFEIDRSRVRVHLQIHTTQDYSNLKQFWANLLGLPLSAFIRPTVTKPRGKKTPAGILWHLHPALSRLSFTAQTNWPF